MKEDKKHINFSTDYLQKYLNGELTDKEMQAVEKAALEDPFLSDAIDGLEEAAGHSSSFEADVADLQKRISTPKRVREESEKRKKRYHVSCFPTTPSGGWAGVPIPH